MIAPLILAMLAAPSPDTSVRQLGGASYAAREAAEARLTLACRDDRRYREAAIAGLDSDDPEVSYRCFRVLRQFGCPSCRGNGGVWVGDLAAPMRFDVCPYCRKGVKL